MGIYLGKVKVDMKSPIQDVIPGLSTENIKGGTTVGGVPGKTSVMETEDMTATAGDMLEGTTGAVNGQVITGTIPRKATETYTPSTVDQTIAKGQYLEGDQIIKGDVNLVPENIVKGETIFGVTGTYDPTLDSALFVERKYHNYGSTSLTASRPIKIVVMRTTMFQNVYIWIVGVGVYKDSIISDPVTTSSTREIELTVETYPLKFTLDESGTIFTAYNTQTGQYHTTESSWYLFY